MRPFLSKLRQNFVYFFTSEFLVFASTFVAAYCYARFLGPYTYGYWQTAKIFIGYSTVLGLSLHLVMRRDFVMLLSQNKKEDANRIANLVFTYQVTFIPVVSVLILLYALLFVQDNMLKVTTITIGAIYSLQLIGGFGNILSKGLNNYKLIRNANFLSSILTLTAIPLVYWYGYYALLISTLFNAIVNSLFYYFTIKYEFKFYWNWKLFKNLLIISLPIYFQEISSTVFESIDRLLIAKYLTVESVGFYSLSGMVAVPLRLLISTFSVVLFTQLNSEYGFDKGIETVKRHVIIPQDLISYAISPFLIVLLIVLPHIVQIFLPAYVQGVTATQISVLASFFYLMSTFSANALFVLDKQMISAAIFVFVGLLNLGLCVVTLSRGMGIEGVAASTFVAYLLYDVLMLATIYKIIGLAFKSLFGHLLSILAPVCYTIIFLIAYFRFVEPFIRRSMTGSQVQLFAVSLFIGIVGAGPLFYLAFKKARPYISNAHHKTA